VERWFQNNLFYKSSWLDFCYAGRIKTTIHLLIIDHNLLPETGASTIITFYFVIIYRRKFDLVNILHNLFLDKSIKFANLNTYHDCLFFSRQKTACMQARS